LFVHKISHLVGQKGRDKKTLNIFKGGKKAAAATEKVGKKGESQGG